MKTTFKLRVNGTDHTVTARPGTPLLYILRNQLALNGPKFGCGLEQCGACMVSIDGETGPSCRKPVDTVSGKEILTIEGLRSENGNLHPVQQAFIEEQAAQCGFCTNGIVMNTVALLRKNPDPTEAEIKEHLQRNICRCGVHSRVVKAVLKAAKQS